MIVIPNYVLFTWKYLGKNLYAQVLLLEILISWFGVRSRYRTFL